MRNLLIATAALSLIGGAAFAQVNANTPGAMASPGSTEGETTATTPADSGLSTGVHNAPAGGAMSSGSTSDGSMNTGSAGSMASNTPAGSAPTNYPVCTSKHEDRCVNRSQSTRMASTRTHHMKSTSTSDASAPAG